MKTRMLGGAATVVAAVVGLSLVACGGGGGGSGGDGASGTTGTPANKLPTASFTLTSTKGVVPLAVTLDASASKDADGSIVSYQWNFGDSSTAAGASTTHTFIKPGRFEITLTVTDDDHATASTAWHVIPMSTVAARSYKLAVIQPIGGTYAEPRAINSRGEVAGSGETASGQVSHAFPFSNGATRDLGTLGGLESYARDINDSGEIVGHSDTTAGLERAFVYRNGRMQDLGTLGGTFSQANAINAAGTIVGQADDGDGNYRCFVHSGGQMTALGTLGGDYCDAHAINDRGHIAGRSSTASGEIRAFVMIGNTLNDIGRGQPSTDIWVEAMNDDDDVVGMWMPGSGYPGYTGFLYRDGVMRTLVPSYSEPIDVNNAGVVVGYALFGSEGHAFVWDEANGMQDLNRLIDPGLRHTLVVVQGINDAGQITGHGTRADGSHVAFVLDPVW